MTWPGIEPTPHYCFKLFFLFVFILSFVGVWLLDGVWIGFVFIALITQLVITSNTELPLINTLQFTVTHTLEFSVFTSCILATDFNTVIIPITLNYTLQIPYVKCSLRRLTFKSQLNSLPSSLSQLRLPSQETPSVIIPAGLGSRYIASGRTQQKTSFALLYPNNNSIVAYVFVAAGTCLPSRCLTMNLYSGSNIPAFRRHVTICLRHSGVSRNSTSWWN
jgi:hypothetical protein